MIEYAVHAFKSLLKNPKATITLVSAAEGGFRGSIARATSGSSISWSRPMTAIPS